MSAAEKSHLKERRVKSGGRLGIIAGGGALPEKLACACEAEGIEPFIVAFKGQTDPACVKNRAHHWLQLRTAGHTPDILRAQNITNAVMIGAIRRPSLFELIPDAKTAKVIKRIGLGTLGDDGILVSLRRWLEEEGLHIEGIHKYAPALLVSEGVLGSVQPEPGDQAEIARGLELSQKLGSLDIGQSIIIQQGIVLGVEAIEGTDRLIRRCRKLRRKGRGGILVKTCKPQQDRDLDLPVIGLKTIVNAQKTGLAGIVLHAGASMIIDREAVIEKANRAGIFLLGAAS